MMKKWFEKSKELSRLAWEKFKVFWFTVAVPWVKALTPKRALKLLAVAFMAGVLFIASLFFVLSFGLPTVESLKDYKPNPGTIILAEDGRVLGQVKIEKGIYVPLKRIPKYMKDAIIAMSGGMGVKLYATISGLSGAMLLSLQYQFLDSGADDLVALITKVIEVQVAPFLKPGAAAR